MIYDTRGNTLEIDSFSFAFLLLTIKQLYRLQDHKKGLEQLP